MFESYVLKNKEEQKNWRVFRAKKAFAATRKADEVWYAKSLPHEALIYSMEGIDLCRPSQVLTYKIFVNEEGPNQTEGKRIDLPDKQFEIKLVLNPHFLVVGKSAGDVQGTRQIGNVKKTGLGEYEAKVDAPREEGTYYANVMVKGKRLFRDTQCPLIVALPPKEVGGPLKFTLEADLDSAKAGSVMPVIVTVTDQTGESVDVSLVKISAKLHALNLDTPSIIDVPVDYHAGTGTYELDVKPAAAGAQALEVYYNGQRVTRTEFKAHDGIDVKETRAIHIHDQIKMNAEGNLQIEPRTQTGQPLLVGGDQFEVTVSSIAPVQLRAYEGQRGQYLVRYTFEAAGEYELHIKWNEHEIGNSPIKIVVEQ